MRKILLAISLVLVITSSALAYCFLDQQCYRDCLRNGNNTLEGQMYCQDICSYCR